MAAKPKLSHEEWAKVRKAWESDPRDGYVWLIEEMSVPLTRAALRKVAIREGWTKNAIGKVSKNPVKVLDNNPGDSPDHCADKGSDKKVSSPKVSKVSKKLMVSKVSEATETIGDDQVEESKKNPGGRPTLYREDYAKQAYRLCLLGATDEDLAEAFEVDKTTIIGWKSTYPEFYNFITQGKTEADAKVAESTYKLAVGDVYIQEEKLARDGSKVTLKRQIPPDPAAQRMWLFNRRPKQWKNKVEVKEEVDLNIFPPKERLEEIYSRAFAEAEKRRDALIGRGERLGLVIDNDTGDLIGDL